ncbi:MAG: helix-turn-helix domain-containing protein [Sphaerochaetaceae bacterium]|jgi:two-component system response regulator YesN|nr:AraC family transcriptional regulator [Sphaerochaetaceae bacterium]
MAEKNREMERFQTLARQYEGACKVPCAVLDSEDAGKTCIPCPLYGTSLQCEGCWNSMLFNFGQSLRFGGSYVFFCPGSLMFWASPLVSEAKVSHGLIAGPVLVLPSGELDEGLLQRMGSRIEAVVQKDAGDVSSLAEVLRMVAGWASEYQDNLAASYRSLEIQGKLFDIIQDCGGDEENGMLYSTDLERELMDAVANRDLETAQAAAEKEIWLFSHYHSEQSGMLRMRMQEMVTLFSRAALRSHADEAQVWTLCQKLYSSLAFQRPIEGQISWIKTALAQFVGLISDESRGEYSADVEKAIRYANGNYRRSVSLAEVSEKVGLSLNYFCRIFRAETGQTWVEYLNRTRVEKACNLLSGTKYEMSKIGEASGFGSQITFCKVFRRIKGMSPSEFRKQHTRIFV